jgi:hypothetical protein
MPNVDLTTQDRIQMFCYYNTLAWEILAVTIAGVIVLGTMPLIVSHELGKNATYFVVNEVFAGVFFGGGVSLMWKIRTYADRWISWPGSNSFVTIQKTIDRIEMQPWKASSSRTVTTWRYMILFVVVVLLYFAFQAFFWYNTVWKT